MTLPFAHPWVLLALPPLVVLWWRVHRRAETASTALRYAPLDLLPPQVATWRQRARGRLFLLGLAGLVLLLLAAARPQGAGERFEISGEAVDVLVALDVSRSMAATDVGGGTRLDAARDVVLELLESRPHDRFAVLAFAGEAMTLCPLTRDRDAVRRMLERASIDLLPDGTALGMALVTAVNRMERAGTVGRIVILVTDGVNNRGQVAPLTAASLAADRGIRVYPVGIGGEEERPAGRLDEDTLRRIAEVTTGSAESYSRAYDRSSLRGVFARIDGEVPRTEVEVTYRRSEFFAWLAIPALVLLAAEAWLAAGPLRVVPE